MNRPVKRMAYYFGQIDHHLDLGRPDLADHLDPVVQLGPVHLDPGLDRLGLRLADLE